MADLSVVPQGQAGGVASGKESGGVDDTDFRSLFAKTSKDLDDQRSHAKKLQDKLAGVESSSAETKGTLEAIKKALMGGDGEEVNETEQRIGTIDQQIDHLLDVAMEADRAGKPISVTAEIGLNALKFQKEVLPMLEQLRAQNASLEKQVKALSDPSMHIDNQAYSNFDNQIIQALDALYGPDDSETKELQFDAVSKRISKELKELKADDPSAWDRMRRDREAQLKLVNWAVKKQIPPKARQIMDDDKIMRTELTPDELMNAHREARAQGKSAEAETIRRKLLQGVLEKSMKPGKARFGGGERA